jgi:hypothetical protein
LNPDCNTSVESPSGPNFASNFDQNRRTGSEKLRNMQSAAAPSTHCEIWQKIKSPCQDVGSHWHFPLSHFGLWTLELLIRGNVIIRKAPKAIHGDDCRPRRSSWPRFPLLAPTRDPFESGASSVARVSDRGRLP